jgi:hypothetical protein
MGLMRNFLYLRNRKKNLPIKIIPFALIFYKPLSIKIEHSEYRTKFLDKFGKYCKNNIFPVEIIEMNYCIYKEEEEIKYCLEAKANTTYINTVYNCTSCIFNSYLIKVNFSKGKFVKTSIIRL